jgi:hypothetical protein
MAMHARENGYAKENGYAADRHELKGKTAVELVRQAGSGSALQKRSPAPA